MSHRINNRAQQTQNDGYIWDHYASTGVNYQDIMLGVPLQYRRISDTSGYGIRLVEFGYSELVVNQFQDAFDKLCRYGGYVAPQLFLIEMDSIFQKYYTLNVELLSSRHWRRDHWCQYVPESESEDSDEPPWSSSDEESDDETVVSLDGEWEEELNDQFYFPSRVGIYPYCVVSHDIQYHDDTRDIWDRYDKFPLILQDKSVDLKMYQAYKDYHMKYIKRLDKISEVLNDDTEKDVMYVKYRLSHYKQIQKAHARFVRRKRFEELQHMIGIGLVGRLEEKAIPQSGTFRDVDFWEDFETSWDCKVDPGDDHSEEDSSESVHAPLTRVAQVKEDDSSTYQEQAAKSGTSLSKVETDSTIGIDILQRFTTMVQELAAFAQIKNAEDIIAEMEGIAALIITIQGCKNYTAITSAVFLYARKYFNKSVAVQVLSYLREFFTFEAQSGIEDLIGSTDWISLMRNLQTNWRLVRENKLFTHFSKLLGLVVTMGMCKASSLTFSVKNYRVWEPDMKLIHGSAMDIADAALSTVTFFVESVALCWKQQSLRPLLVSDKAATELDEEYANVVSMWDLVKNGNLEKVAKVSDQEFDNRLEALAGKLKSLMSTRVSFEKKLIQDKFMKLLQIKNDYITLKIASGVRKAPYCVEFCGGSSQGKTTCGEQVVQALLTIAGLPTDKKYRATYNAGDKYMSAWTTDKIVMTIDDMVNDKSDHVERPPTRIIIDVCNNTPFYANMADLDQKGKVFVEPAMVVVTTNMKDLDARTYSNCPYSIQRRMHAVITVKVKPEFQLLVGGKPAGIDSDAVDKFYEKQGKVPTFDDIWLLTVERAVEPPKLTMSASYVPIEFRGRPLKDAPFRVVLQYLIEDFQKHRRNQQNIIERMEARSKPIQLCNFRSRFGGEYIYCKQIRGYCDEHDHIMVEEEIDHEKQFGEELTEAVSTVRSQASDIVLRCFGYINHGSETTIDIMNAARHFMEYWDWMKCIPTPWLKNTYLRNVLLITYVRDIKNSYIKKTIILWCGVTAIIFIACTFSSTCLRLAFISGALIVGITVQKYMVKLVKQEFLNRLYTRNCIAPMTRALRDRHVATFCKAGAAIGGIYAMARLYKSWRALQPQGSLEPRTARDVEERDAESSVWSRVVARPLPVPSAARNSTSAQLSGLISKNLVYGTVTMEDRLLSVNGIFLTSNIVVIPNHYFEEETIDVTFRKQNPTACGGKFAARLSKNLSWKDPTSDIRYCYCSTGGSFKDISKYLIDEEIPLVEFSLMWRAKDGNLVDAYGLATAMKTGNGVENFRGYRYQNLTINTFKGMCGATLYARHKPILLGIHLGGLTGAPKGCAGFIFKKSYDTAMEHIRTCEGTLVTGSAEKFEPHVLGKTIITGQELHRKSPLNYMPKNSQVEYYGSCAGMTTFISRVKPTLISEKVTEITGQPNIYGPPLQTPQYFGWQAALSNLAVPALPFPPPLLELAIKDYKEDLVGIIRHPLWNSCTPLTDHQNLNGIPGKKFMDAIKLDTSIGFPLSGPKRQFVEDFGPDLNGHNNRVFDPVIMDEIKRCEDCYKNGERAYPIAKACKKDEVLSKPKCRIFYGNSISLTFLVRKYYLPLLRVLQMNPLVSECAVGVNSHGPEWDVLYRRITHFGEDRLVGGDYSKYDQKLPSQLIIAALRILIDLAKECNYSDEDIKIMEAMAGDIVYAIIAYNGDLIGLTEGTHISGNSLTVIINGICGSLNQRCYFYSMNPSETYEGRLKFRDYISLITYGDDNIGSVSSEINNFTIKGMSTFLKEYGQIYTMPDKETELSDFLPLEDFEFLKRKSVYIEELNYYVGALVDASLFKMLHCYIREKNAPITEEHACALNIDTALREWFNHGKDVYEYRRSQMEQIAKQCNISHLCTELTTTFEMRCTEWRCKYLDEHYELFNEPDNFEV